MRRFIASHDPWRNYLLWNLNQHIGFHSWHVIRFQLTNNSGTGIVGNDFFCATHGVSKLTQPRHACWVPLQLLVATIIDTYSTVHPDNGEQRDANRTTLFEEGKNRFQVGTLLKPLHRSSLLGLHGVKLHCSPKYLTVSWEYSFVHYGKQDSIDWHLKAEIDEQLHYNTASVVHV